MPHYVYILECQNNSYYTGYTTDINRRYAEHVKGSSKCRYTRSFPPRKLAAYWEFKTKSDALVVEHRIKQLSKLEKLEMISKWSDEKQSSD